MSTNLGHSKCNPWRTGADFAKGGGGGGIMTPPDKAGLRVTKLIDLVQPNCQSLWRTKKPWVYTR